MKAESFPSAALSPELQAIRDFLAECMPFEQLADGELDRIAGAMEIDYFRRGHVFTSHEDPGGLRILRSGAAELRAEDGRLVDRFGETISFNLMGLSQEQPGIRATLIEDSLIYRLPEPAYQQLRLQHRDFDRFFHSQRNRRVRRAARRETNPSEMMKQLRDLMSTQLLWVEPGVSIQQTAQKMTARRVSSAMIMDHGPEQGGRLLGIVTDRDIRSRAMATGIDAQAGIDNIMTKDPVTIDAEETLFDATLFMTQRGFHHIPVKDKDTIVGMITSSDLMLARRDDPVYLVQHISRQQSVEGLRKIIGLLPDLLVQWVNAGIRASQVAHLLTAISDAVTVKLITLAEQELGPPPRPYCWLGFGSQGRDEQLLGGDQDNALLIADGLEPAEAVWFEKLAHRVCDGLNACGYVYCPGGVMATTDEWRQPLSGWCNTVDRWTRSPTADAVMRVSIFFDLRAIHGDASLCRQLQQHMLKRTGGNTIFLAALAENVLDSPPPLGIFRRFVVEHNGEHADELNLKKRAVIPIVDIVRIHALAHGITEVNTLRRLHALVRQKALTIGDSRNLEDALRVIQQTRVEGQVRQLMNGEKPGNYLNPDHLPKLVKKQLRDAFGVVVDAQQAVKLSYRPGM
jgi:CBS domain-containing protein